MCVCVEARETITSHVRGFDRLFFVDCRPVPCARRSQSHVDIRVEGRRPHQWHARREKEERVSEGEMTVRGWGVGGGGKHMSTSAFCLLYCAVCVCVLCVLQARRHSVGCEKNERAAIEGERRGRTRTNTCARPTGPPLVPPSSPATAHASARICVVPRVCCLARLSNIYSMDCFGLGEERREGRKGGLLGPPGVWMRWPAKAIYRLRAKQNARGSQTWTRVAVERGGERDVEHTSIYNTLT